MKLWHENRDWAVLLNPKKYSSRIRPNQFNHPCVRLFHSTTRNKSSSDEEIWLHRCIVKLIDDLRALRNPDDGNESEEIDDTVEASELGTSSSSDDDQTGGSAARMDTPATHPRFMAGKALMRGQGYVPRFSSSNVQAFDPTARTDSRNYGVQRGRQPPHLKRKGSDDLGSVDSGSKKKKPRSEVKRGREPKLRKPTRAKFDKITPEAKLENYEELYEKCLVTKPVDESDPDGPRQDIFQIDVYRVSEPPSNKLVRKPNEAYIKTLTQRMLARPHAAVAPLLLQVNVTTT